MFRKVALFSEFSKTQTSGWKPLIIVYLKYSLEKSDYFYLFVLTRSHSTVSDSNRNQV